MNEKPWLRGIIDNIKATDLIRLTILENKNRIMLILLDTALEIAFKDYLIYEFSKPIKIDKKLTREELHKIVKKNTSFKEEIWKKISYYYEIRCDLYHETAGKTLMDSDINGFYKLVLYVITSLFDIDTDIFTQDPRDLIIKKEIDNYIPINKLKPLEKVIVIVARNKVKSSTEISELMRRMGCKKVIAPTTITTYMTNPSYKHYFHKGNGEIMLSDEGYQYYSKIQEQINKMEE